MAALAGVRVELPAVVGAFNGSAVKTAERKRKRAVRADITQREGFSRGVAPQHQRNFQQHGALELSPVQLIAAQRRIPESPQHFAAGVAPVFGGGVGHRGAYRSTAAVPAAKYAQSILRR